MGPGPRTITRTEDGAWLGVPLDELTAEQRARVHRHRAELEAAQIRAEQTEARPRARASEPSAEQIAGDHRAGEHALCAVCGLRAAVASAEDGRRICRAPTCVKRARRARGRRP